MSSKQYGFMNEPQEVFEKRMNIQPVINPIKKKISLKNKL